MFKSKHSGWTWDLKRTPFGGGGGWFDNALHSVTDTVSGWDPHITEGTGDWLTENGWVIPLAMITAGAASAAAGGGAAVVGEGAVAGSSGAVAADGTIFAAGEAIPAGTSLASGSAATTAGDVFAGYSASGSAAGTAGSTVPEGYGAATSLGQSAYDSALANGASHAQAQAAADAAYNSTLQTAGQYTAAGGEASNLTPEMIQYANASPDPIGTINQIAGMTPQEFSSYTQIIGGPGNAAGFTAGEDLAQLMKSYPNLTQAQLQDILQINYGTDQLLSADAANLAAQGYDAATIDQVLGYSYTPTELAGTGIESSSLNAASSSGLSDTLKNINRARQLSKLLGIGSGSVSYKMPSSQDWLKNAQQVALNQPAQQQFGGLYEMNKNPFTFQNPTAALLAGGNKTPAGLDVSGTQGTALDTTQQNKIYSSLLRS